MADNRATATDITIGALLHDIGKLVQRADPMPSSKTHQVFGAEWLEGFDFLRKFSGYALWHHSKDARKEKAPSIMIVNQADMLAAGERVLHEEQDETGWAKDTPLLSLFSKIRIEGREKEIGGSPSFKAYYYPPKRVDQVIFPHESIGAERATIEHYRLLLSGLENNLQEAESIFGVRVLLFILEKYLSYIPSDTKVEPGIPERDPDISLFDHAKLTAAIASSLYLYLDSIRPNQEDWDEELVYDLEERRFLVVDVDISGIQNFIYNISSKGALRSLRARSFYLEMVCENVTSKILDDCGLERTNIIFSGGGRARLLLPNTETAKKVLRSVERETNQFFRQYLAGGLGLNLAWEEFAGSEMMGAPDGEASQKRTYCQVLQDLANKLELRKGSRLREEVLEFGFKLLGPFEPAPDECRICHAESEDLEPLREDTTVEETVLACPVCKNLYELGGYLRNLEKVWMGEAEASGDFHSMRLPFGNLIWKRSPGASERVNKRGIILANTWDLACFDSPSDYRYGYPHYREGDDFSDLAEKSCGEHRLGVLRMDVDNLGQVFRDGIREKERSFSRISVLSRMVNTYFREILPMVLRGIGDGYEHFTVLEETVFPRALEIVYAGGDDLFIVGAWDQLIEAAFDIHRSFSLFVCENPDLHISGGIIVSNHDYPLYNLARLAEISEHSAKSHHEEKDCVEIFGRPAKWGEYEEAAEKVLLPILNLGNGVKGKIKTANGSRCVALPLSRGFLRQIMSIALQYEGNEKAGGKGKLVFPYLAYTVARTREGIEGNFRKEILSRSRWEMLERSLFEPDLYKVIYALASWADLLARGGNSHG